jgi:hypothetical protein
MASSDDEILAHEEYEDDNRHWLPIIAATTSDKDENAPNLFFPALSPTPPSSPVASTSATKTGPCSWSNIINEHQVLLSNKPNMDRRRFNKSVFMLLNKTISLAQQHLQQANSASIPHTVNEWEDPKHIFAKFRKELLNPKEMKSEELVESVVAYVNQTLPSLLTADEHKEELQKKSLALLQDLSPQMSIKLAPIVKSYIVRQFGANIEDLLAEVHLPEMSLKEKTNMYTRMLNNFFSDVGCISFALSNRKLLGNLTPSDLWFLTFFAFVTARRCRGDNLLMLGCVGK